MQDAEIRMLTRAESPKDLPEENINEIPHKLHRVDFKHLDPRGVYRMCRGATE
jgi:hypothetical protein